MKNIIFFILSCTLLACSGRNKVPPEIIKQKEMLGILWDVIRAQSLSTEMARKDSTINEVAQTKAFTQKIFEIHHITSGLFDQSYAWYTSHPEVLKIMLDSLNVQNQRQTDMRTKERFKPFLKDSLKRIHR